MEIGQAGRRQTKRAKGLQATEEDGVIDGMKSCTKVKEEENDKGARIKRGVGGYLGLWEGLFQLSDDFRNQAGMCRAGFLQAGIARVVSRWKPQPSCPFFLLYLHTLHLSIHFCFASLFLFTLTWCPNVPVKHITQTYRTPVSHKWCSLSSKATQGELIHLSSCF